MDCGIERGNCGGAGGVSGGGLLAMFVNVNATGVATMVTSYGSGVIAMAVMQCRGGCFHKCCRG